MGAEPGSGRIRELDGLRGVAILLVVVGHLWSGLAPHYNRLLPSTRSFTGFAFFGVTLFFALSGFLITRLLVAERESTGHVDFRGFYARRARRLLPALVVVVVVCVAFAVVAGHSAAETSGTAIRSLLYVENVGDVLGIPTTGALEHCWSLATEEQFYLVWPVVLALALRRGRGVAIAIAATAAAGTVAIRAIVLKAGGDPYGIVHWDALMLGALIALVPWRPNRTMVAAAGALVLSQTLVYLTSDGFAAMGNLQYLLYAGTSAVFVAAAPHARWLRSKILVHFGMISYGLYLWHALLMRFDAPGVLGVAMAIGAAELSYHFVELRFLTSRPEHIESGAAVVEPEWQPADSR